MLALTPTLTGLHSLCLHRSIVIFQIAIQLVWLSPSSVPGFLKVLGLHRVVVWMWSVSSRLVHLNMFFPVMFGKVVEA